MKKRSTKGNFFFFREKSKIDETVKRHKTKKDYTNNDTTKERDM